MKAKKLAAVLTAAFIFLAGGCSAETAAVSEPSATPSLTAAPKTGIEAVFGAPVTLALISGGDDAQSALFFEAAEKEAKSMGAAVVTKALGKEFAAKAAETAAGADAVVAFLPDAETDASALAATGKPTAVFETQAGTAADTMSLFYYEAGSELDMAFNAALVYPPHETPVRLILMFENADSPAYAAYRKLFEEGKIFPKEIYIASEAETDAGAWLTEKLERYAEGMLDAVFAEDPALASGAFDALTALNRTDMEVFCPGVTADITARMQKSPDVFAQCIGRNDALAGVLCVRAALQMLHGEQAVTQALEPEVIDAADLGDDAAAAMAAGSGKAALYNADWMDTLRSFYSGAKDAAAK